MMDEGERIIQKMEDPASKEFGLQLECMQENLNKKNEPECPTRVVGLEHVIEQRSWAGEILSHLSWRDLLSFRQVSTRCQAAFESYVGFLQSIDISTEKFRFLSENEKSTIYGSTSNLRVFNCDEEIPPDDLAKIFLKNNLLSRVGGWYMRPIDRVFTSDAAAPWSRDFSNLSALDLNCRGYDKDTLRSFFGSLARHCGRLRELSLVYYDKVCYFDQLVVIDHACLSSLQTLPLELFHLKGFTCVGTGMDQLLASCQRLRSLEILNCQYMCQVLSDVATNCSNLEHFLFVEHDFAQNCDWTELSRIVRANPKLRSFHVESVDPDTTFGVEELREIESNLTDLEGIYLQLYDDLDTLEPAFFSLLKSFPNLQHIGLEMIDLKPGWLSQVAATCKNLRKFEFNFASLQQLESTEACDRWYEELTQIIRSNPQLRVFDIENEFNQPTIDGKCLDAMARHLEHLEELRFRLEDTALVVSDNFFAVVRKFTNLKRLDINADNIPQEWLDEIGANCTNLEELRLTETDNYFEVDEEEMSSKGDFDFLVAISDRNWRLRYLEVSLKRRLTLEACQSLARRKNKLDELVMCFDHNDTNKEYTRLLEDVYENTDVNEESFFYPKQYSPPDEGEDDEEELLIEELLLNGGGGLDEIEES